MMLFFCNRIIFYQSSAKLSTWQGNPSKATMKSRYDELEILISKFTRQLPNDPEYAKRLEEELEIIANLNFANISCVLEKSWISLGTYHTSLADQLEVA